ncbi:DUF4153 domain-containing protein [Rhodoflexus caldus]|uniref:DUF4153 domain-containing protein n=1 Tax=Rhodoflexus caldus TaxID=2891236 RepID=UPI002029CA9F|nr:DUF4153 domain-containing protein [Rhodoflexus caldus]
MEESIKNNLNSPHELEKLYREDKISFKRAFDNVYPDIQHHMVSQVWYERLRFGQEKISWGVKNELPFVIVLAAIAGIVVNIPDWIAIIDEKLAIDDEYFYTRHLGFLFLPMLMVYFAWKKQLRLLKSILPVVGVTLSVAYMNLLPDNSASDTLGLACIHMPLLMWALWGYSFMGQDLRNYIERINFLRFNGDLVILTTIMLLAGGILSGITFGLFSLIDINIANFYFPNVMKWGIVAAPIIGSYLVQANPQLVKNVSPVIAKVFTPLVLIMLVVYLATIVYTGKNPYNDRDFLIIFNLLLIGVMAIILFAVTETAKNSAARWNHRLLFILSVVTIVINAVALSAIIFRISEWGITPNRLAVLGGNLLILTNLIAVAYWLMHTLKNPRALEKVDNSIAAFLPVYTLWTIIVIFIFPVLFNFR